MTARLKTSLWQHPQHNVTTDDGPGVCVPLHKSISRFCDNTMTEAAATEETGYIKTTTHNFVSRQAKIDGAKQVEIKGRSILEEGVHVRGDLHIVRIGRYCDIGRNTILEPPLNPLMKNASEYKQKYIPMAIGSHTKIGENCEVYAAAIGSSECRMHCVSC
jgi:dynactin-5